MNIFANSLIIERVKQAMGANTDKEVAEKLGTNSSTLANWKNPTKQKPSLAELTFEYAEKNNIDLNWLILGKVQNALNEMEVELLKRFNQLDFSQKLNALNQLGNSSNSGITQTVTGGNVTNLAGGNIVRK